MIEHYPLAIDGILREKFTDEADYRRAVELADLHPLSGYRPLPQARKFHASAKRVRMCTGGNRSSKSTGVAFEVMYFATGGHPWRQIPTPNVGWYATLTWEMVGAILWPKLRPLLEGAYKFRVAWHNKGRDIPERIGIDVPGGESLLIFKAYEQGREAFQGVDRLYIANDEQMPHDVWIEQVSRIGGRWPLNIYNAFTPIIPQAWMQEKTEKPPQDWSVFEFPLDDNRISRGGFIADSEIDAAIEEWPPEVRDTRRNGKWGSFSGAVFTTFARSVHVVDEQREGAFIHDGKLDPSLRSIGSIDWGGANPFVHLWAVRMAALGGAWYVFDELYWDFRKRGPRLLKDRAADILERDAMWGAHVERRWADHDPTDAAELANYGVPSWPAMKGGGSAAVLGAQTAKLRNIEILQTAIKINASTGRPDIYIADRCVNLIRELQGYRWAEGTDKASPKAEPLKKDDHCVDALLYLVASEHLSNVGSSQTGFDYGSQFERTFK